VETGWAPDVHEICEMEKQAIAIWRARYEQKITEESTEYDD
jgi:hypothetical protein